ncbi:MAG: hypothetical protein J2P54_05070, partial [Bradyrhizobiaceae bacterium]|nr:hypothetical protein [Bradyrhizobiaceae bacterium]
SRPYSSAMWIDAVRIGPSARGRFTSSSVSHHTRGVAIARPGNDRFVLWNARIVAGAIFA